MPMPARTRRFVLILVFFSAAAAAIFFIPFASFSIGDDSAAAQHGGGAHVVYDTSLRAKNSKNLQALQGMQKKIKALRQPVEQMLSKVGQANRLTVPPMLLSPNHNLAYHEDRPRIRTILILVDSYQESMCEASISSAFENADSPESIFVGLVEEHTKETHSCISAKYALCNQSAFCASDQIKVRRLDPSVSRGQSFARAVASGVFRGEQYVLFANSQTVFVKKWDTLLIMQYAAAKEKAVEAGKPPRVVLSAPGLPAESIEKVDLQSPTNKASRVCKAAFHDAPPLRGLKQTVESAIHGAQLQFEAVVEEAARTAIHQPFVSLQFLFAEASLLAEVPLDPHLAFLSAADEELLFTMRLWSKEFSSFAVSQVVAYSIAEAVTSPKVDERLETSSRWRMLYLTRAVAANDIPEELRGDVTKDADPFMLGEDKTAAQFFAEMGIDTVSCKLTKDWCHVQAGSVW